VKIGDLVWEYIGGPIMRIVQLLEAGGVAVCRLLWSDAVKRVAVTSLIAVGMAVSAAHGHPPEDPPARNQIEYQCQTPTIATSGAQTLTPPPPRVMVNSPPDADLLHHMYLTRQVIVSGRPSA
jgi:hypothetical protein